MNRFKMILFGCAGFLAMLLGSVSLSAQANDAQYASGLYAEPTQTLVNETVAKSRVTAKITELKSAVASLTEGTPAFRANDMTLNFYGSLLGHLESGNTVKQSLVNGLVDVTSYYDLGAPSPTEVSDLRTQAIALLR